jgi:hypothetical protein
VLQEDSAQFTSLKSFELFQLASVRTFQQHVWMTLSVWPAMEFLSKTQIWKDRCNRPDALIHKASIAFKIQTSGRQSSWSGCVSIRYGNCMHQINHPKDHFLGLDARSLDMEITCSRSATVQTTGHHCLYAAQIRKEFLWILESRSHSCLSGPPMTSVRTTPRFYQARRSFEPLAYK